MATLDLGPATRQMVVLLRNIPDDLLDAPTPCPAYRLRDLLDHVGGLSVAFTAAATKAIDPAGGPPTVDGSRLEPDWRDRIAADLDGLAAAWRAPDAWTGMTRAGGLDLPGEIAGIVALDELVLHGWDVARATGQPFDVDAASLDAVQGFVEQFSGPGQESQREGLFGPEVRVPEGAPQLDRVLAMSGRDPSWTSPAVS